MRASYSEPSFLPRTSLRPLRNAGAPSPMMATKCTPSFGFDWPFFRSVAKAVRFSCILLESSSRRSCRMTRVRKTLAKGVSFMRPPDEVAFPAALTYGRRAGVFWLVLERVRQLYWSSFRGDFGQTGSVLGQAARAAALSEVRLRQRLQP